MGLSPFTNMFIDKDHSFNHSENNLPAGISQDYLDGVHLKPNYKKYYGGIQTTRKITSPDPRRMGERRIDLDGKGQAVESSPNGGGVDTEGLPTKN